MLTDAACVVQNKIGVLFIGTLAIADFEKNAADRLAVTYIHLASECLDIEKKVSMKQLLVKRSTYSGLVFDIFF